MSERPQRSVRPTINHPDSYQSDYPVFPLWPLWLRFSAAQKRRAARKAAHLANSVLGTISPPPPPPQPVSPRQSPSLQSAPAHSPRWPPYRCKHPHKGAGFHPRASPARWFRPAPSSPYKADDDDHCGSALDLKPPGRTRPCPAPLPPPSAPQPSPLCAQPSRTPRPSKPARPHRLLHKESSASLPSP